MNNHQAIFIQKAQIEWSVKMSVLDATDEVESLLSSSIISMANQETNSICLSRIAQHFQCIQTGEATQAA